MLLVLKGPPAKDCGQPLEAGKGKDSDPPGKEGSSGNSWILALCAPFWISTLQNCKIINMYCLRLHVCGTLSAAVGNQYSLEEQFVKFVAIV